MATPQLTLLSITFSANVCRSGTAFSIAREWGKGSEQAFVIAAIAEDNDVVKIDAVQMRSAFDHASFSRLVRGDFDVPRR